MWQLRIWLELKNCNVILIAAKITSLSWCVTDKYEYIIGEEILPSDQSRMLEQAKFTYSPPGKDLKNREKRLKTKVESK